MTILTLLLAVLIFHSVVFLPEVLPKWATESGILLAAFFGSVYFLIF